ncbi:polypeptide N-acetylgalactosaminyltransferase [Intrasporangium oryzae NRRL B-24470]|uniref:Polypeptide N-acetylgalactosaminyltransferase n=1 Tax=Intrasporangium oryzae NRRL B-24470 TaxID=1386089 RepID=W9GFZ1_9MICO|nr:glycosyltransferase [Intrasporangium oryzae]EWT02794.1 polypeptide N-acetylgalactosaminyltransferase [Intrasporangium oryzae NRRL B-24470]
MPLITVLMPVRNGTSTLGAALRSTLAALPRDAEIALMDDGSTEDVPGVLDALGSARVHYHRTEQSHGPGAATRALMDRTDSEYVFRMDQDDISFPGRFTLQLRQLRGTDLIVGPAVTFTTRPVRLRPELPLPITAEAMPLHLLVHNPLCHPTMGARRSTLERIGGWRAVRAEDYDLWLRALTAGLRLTRGGVPVLGYRRHGGQVSAEPTYARTALSEPALRQAYTDFVRARFDVEPVWLDRLWGTSADADGDACPGDGPAGGGLDVLRALVDARAARLGPVQRLVLSRTTRLLAGR